MKGRILSLILTGAMAMTVFGALGGCGKKNGSGITKKELSPIEFGPSRFERGEADDTLLCTVPARAEIKTGEEISVTTKIKNTKYWDASHGAVYFVVDWGDGTWSYIGPGLQYDDPEKGAKHSALVQKHVYKRAGEYAVSAAAYAMQSDEVVGWSTPKTVTITGEDYERQDTIDAVKPISSPAEKGYGPAAICDNGAGYFMSKPSADIRDEQYAGYLFDDVYTLEHVEIKIPEAAEVFPSNIAVEYTTDRGKSWQSLPKYYYLYDYSKGRFEPIMHFPNPKGATLSLKLDGIVANGLRLTGKLGSVKMEDMLKEKRLYVEEMRVYGTRRTLLYTSLGETFDGDLNNMWTIFGTAKTEPVVVGSLLGENTNQSPFRTGSAMIGSTEWLEWNGLKFNFTDYAAVKDIYYNCLKETRYGPDGWSDNNEFPEDGYIWATADGQGHLDMGNHYVYNQIFIMAARNYLLQGNAITETDEEGNVVDFMDVRNKVGQTMRDRLTRAMNYLLNTLHGSTGAITIDDPAHDGTVNGASSNYWDAHRSMGGLSAYENTLFYASLLAYADIEEYQGRETSAASYRELAEKAKKKFNDLFWDEAKGRYITSINKLGERLDFGMTFINFNAAAYGLADEARAKSIYDWIDGKRLIEGDTSTGEDIYGRFKYAARATTLDVSTVKKDGAYYWWYSNDVMSPEPGEFGGFGNQMQNGGTIFYISYYDMLGRLKTRGVEDAYARFTAIIEEFHADSLRRNSYSQHGEYVEGVIGEFPESGLVPYTFIEGFLGLKATAKGLRVRPALPAAMDYAGISEYWFGNRCYSIRVDRSLSAPVVERYGDTYYVKLPADKAYTITPDNRLIAG